MRATVAAAIVVTNLLAAPADAQTRVIRATSSTVRLQVGATALPLTIEGQNMASISSARVLLNGRPATGVTAVVKQATATRVVVELTAAAGVQPGNYTIELLAGRQRIAVPPSIVSVDVATARLRPVPVDVQRRPTTYPAAISATPTMIILGPRESGEVMLTGSNLDELTSAYVVDGNGRLVYHVRAELRPGSATRRAVRLIVPDGPNQRGPFGTPMAIMVNREPGNSAATPARVEVKATYDLYMTCSITPRGTSETITASWKVTRWREYKTVVTVTNHGTNTVAASLPAGSVLVEEFDFRLADQWRTRFSVPASGLQLAPGQSRSYEFTFRFPFEDLPPSSVRYRLVPRDDERNHANNERTCRLPPHPGP